MASNGMLWCRICGCEAFIKAQFSTVCTLDCGHTARPGETEKPTKLSKEQEQRARAERRRYVPPPLDPAPARTPPPERRSPAPIVEAEPVRPSYRPTTSNVAGTIRDLLNKK